MATYKIVRFYADSLKNRQVIRSGLTLEQAQEHCNDPSTREEGVWFDGYVEESEYARTRPKCITVSKLCELCSFK